MRRGIRTPHLLEVLRQVPRHRFVPPDMHNWAYEDGPLSIGLGQTISQPYIVALMTDLCNLQGDETVLEIGTGSGYQAAILAGMAALVHTVERHAELAKRARRTLDELKITNVHIHVGDGTLGWQDAAPYAAIMVTAAAPRVPPILFKQLAPGGRLVIPVGSRWSQVLQRWVRTGEEFDSEDILPVAFVPLRGRDGWETNGMNNGDW